MNRNWKKIWKKIIAFVIINYVIDALDSPVQKKNVLTIGGITIGGITIGGIDYPLVTAEVYRECEGLKGSVLFHSHTLPEDENILKKNMDENFLNMDYREIFTLGNGVFIQIFINADGTIATDTTTDTASDGSEGGMFVMVTVVEKETLKIYFAAQGVDDIVSYNYHESTKKISFEINEVRLVLMVDIEVDDDTVFDPEGFDISPAGVESLLSANYTGIVPDKNIINEECGGKAVNKRAGWFKGSKSMMGRGRKNRL